MFTSKQICFVYLFVRGWLLKHSACYWYSRYQTLGGISTSVPWDVTSLKLTNVQCCQFVRKQNFCVGGENIDLKLSMCQIV